MNIERKIRIGAIKTYSTVSDINKRLMLEKVIPSTIDKTSTGTISLGITSLINTFNAIKNLTPELAEKYMSYLLSFCELFNIEEYFLNMLEEGYTVIETPSDTVGNIELLISQGGDPLSVSIISRIATISSKRTFGKIEGVNSYGIAAGMSSLENFAIFSIRVELDKKVFNIKPHYSFSINIKEAKPFNITFSKSEITAINEAKLTPPMFSFINV